jgi:hypothetical protein
MRVAKTATVSCRAMGFLAALVLTPASAQDGVMAGMADMPGMAPPKPAATHPETSRRAPAPAARAPAASAPALDGEMSTMDMTHKMSGALATSEPMTREASGTSWQPDASVHTGLMVSNGGWMFMGHALLNGVYDWQQGPRGATKGFASGMLMGMAKRNFENGDGLQFRVMLSPEPAMGAGGYPLLLASGETADGHTPLIDRQHPHNLAMELSTTYSHRINEADSVFVYGGLPGEPAFGPPAFMHRLSIMDSPEAPISHHWLDSMHITNGVVTAGWVHADWKAEVSQFQGREPDQDRTAIEPGRLDSTAARLSWNPDRTWALQASWAYQVSPEQLAPQQDERRVSASAIYTIPVGNAGWWSTTAAWGRRQSTGRPGLDAFVLESAIMPSDPWTVFARYENTRTDELTLGLPEGPIRDVAKFSLGAIHDWRMDPHAKLGLGALYAFNFVPHTLAQSYGSADPQGTMIFLRLKID